MSKSYVQCLLSVIFFELLVQGGCGEAGSESEFESESNENLSGAGPLGLAEATVFIDQNGNFALDEGEPSTRTAEDGRYELDATLKDLKGRKLVLMVDENTVWKETDAVLESRFVMISEEGKPEAISVFTTLLAIETELDEAALKTKFGIDEEASLVTDYSSGGEIDRFLSHATVLYGDLYASAASEAGATTKQHLEDTVRIFIDDAEMIADYIAAISSDEELPPSNEAPSTSTMVGEEIFQSIPIDAATMSFGVGMNEITRAVVSGSYCLNVPESDAIPELAISQNTRNYLFRLVKSEKDLRELLNVGGGLDLGTTVVQGSLEGRYINEFRSDKQSVFALIKAEYILSGYKLYGVGLDEAYLEDNADLASYVSNYSAFRNACGDRYLDQVTTGGAYYGLLKITASDSTSKKDLMVKLEGKYGKAGVEVKVRGDLQSNIEESLKDTNVSIVIGSRGVSPEYLGLEGADDQLIDNLDDFFNAADQFIEAVSDPTNECHDDSVAFQKCAYTASFADYATISGGVPRFQKQVENLNFTTKLMGLYEDYKILEGYISTMLVKKNDYVWDGHSNADVFAKKTQVARGKLIMDAAFRKCTTDFNGCTSNPAAQSLQSFNEIIDELPFEAWRNPEDCRDIQRLLGNEDIEGASVYLGGDSDKEFIVSCTQMETSEPKTYLEVQNTSGSPDSLSFNMARNVNPDGSTVSSAYKKLLVNVNYNNLEIINDQPGEQETVSAAEDDSPTAEKNFKQARLGSAVDCYAQSGLAVTNIDLTGTPFHFADNTTFQVDAHPVTRYQWVTTAMKWDDADAHARSLGGHLVVLDSVEEFNSVKKLLKDTDHNVNSWVGLKRTDLAQPLQYQQFVWVDRDDNLTSREQADYFLSGEPNNYNNAEGCGHFWSAYSLSLNDIGCQTLLPFLVEFEMVAPNGEGSVDSTGKVLSGWVNGSVQGECVEVRPTTEVIRLVIDET